MNINEQKLNAKKSARMRHRYFVCTQYSVIKIKSLSYIRTIDTRGRNFNK
ncbi:hypothetical protein [Arsenophonus endosymbiont of Bemisia tabaci]|nr:hypothetical protein [Arsenophonus endosymbiont of Bemisia tabaci]